MKFSLIIPIYNAQSYIEKCVSSILAQTYSDFEILLIDDGSVDNSPKICDELAKLDTRISVFHKKNAGVSSARNTGIAHTKGDYIMFVDADDTLQNDVLGVATEIMEQGGVDVISFGVNIIKKGEVSEIWAMEDFRTAHISEMRPHMNEYIKCIFSSPWNKIYKNTIIKKNNILFNEEMEISEDVCFNIDYYLNVNRIVNIKNAFYNYCLDDANSASRKGRDDIIKACYLRIKMFKVLFCKIGYSNEEADLYLKEELARAVINQFFQAYLTTTKLNFSQRSAIIKNICTDIEQKKMLCSHLEDNYKSAEYKFVLFLLKNNFFASVAVIVTCKALLKKLLKMS